MKKIRYLIEVRAVEGMAWLMRNLPRHLLLAACKVVGLLAWVCDYKGRSVASENVRIAFDGEKGWWETQKIVIGSYQNFARTFADLFWCSTVTPETWRTHFIMSDQALALATQTKGKGVVWVTPHYANFELASLVWGFVDRTFTIVAQDFKNPGLTAIFSAARSATGHKIIPQENAMLRLIKALAKGGNVAFLTDLNVKPSKAAEIIQCFGRKTCVTKLHVALARRMGLIIQPAVCRPLDDGRYEMVVFDSISIDDSISDEAVAQQVWDVFENEIRQHPQWWMWMYKHWRYLPADAEGIEYPAYANISPWFEKMLRERRQKSDGSLRP